MAELFIIDTLAQPRSVGFGPAIWIAIDAQVDEVRRHRDSEVVMAVIVVYEGGPSIDAALRDVQRDTWKFKTWSTRHVAHVGKEQCETLSTDCTRSCKARERWAVA